MVRRLIAEYVLPIRIMIVGFILLVPIVQSCSKHYPFSHAD